MVRTKYSDKHKFQSLKEVEDFANALICKHLLRPDFEKQIYVSFQWLNSIKTGGRCSYRKLGESFTFTIQLSKKFTESNLHNYKWINEVLLHEIAHAIACVQYGTSCGHGLRWKRIAEGLGIPAKSTFNADEYKMNIPKSKYTLTCPVCGHKVAAARHPKRRQSCGVCDNGWNEQKILIVTKNY